MYHPLIENFSKLKDIDLDNKILELNKKYFIAAKFGQGELCTQILTILETLKEEQSDRYNKMLKTSNKNNDTDLEGLINID